MEKYTLGVLDKSTNKIIKFGSVRLGPEYNYKDATIKFYYALEEDIQERFKKDLNIVIFNEPTPPDEVYVYDMTQYRELPKLEYMNLQYYVCALTPKKEDIESSCRIDSSIRVIKTFDQILKAKEAYTDYIKGISFECEMRRRLYGELLHPVTYDSTITIPNEIIYIRSRDNCLDVVEEFDYPSTSRIYVSFNYVLPENVFYGISVIIIDPPNMYNEEEVIKNFLRNSVDIIEPGTRRVFVEAGMIDFTNLKR